MATTTVYTPYDSVEIDSTWLDHLPPTDHINVSVTRAQLLDYARDCLSVILTVTDLSKLVQYLQIAREMHDDQTANEIYEQIIGVCQVQVKTQFKLLIIQIQDGIGHLKVTHEFECVNDDEQIAQHICQNFEKYFSFILHHMILSSGVDQHFITEWVLNNPGKSIMDQHLPQSAGTKYNLFDFNYSYTSTLRQFLDRVIEHQLQRSILFINQLREGYFGQYGHCTVILSVDGQIDESVLIRSIQDRNPKADQTQCNIM